MPSTVPFTIDTAVSKKDMALPSWITWTSCYISGRQNCSVIILLFNLISGIATCNTFVIRESYYLRKSHSFRIMLSYYIFTMLYERIYWEFEWLWVLTKTRQLLKSVLTSNEFYKFYCWFIIMPGPCGQLTKGARLGISSDSLQFKIPSRNWGES